MRRTRCAAGAGSIDTAASCVVTPSARDFLQQHGIELVWPRPADARPLQRTVSSVPAESRCKPPPIAASSPRRKPKPIKKEICAVGRKLWMRQFVDGNGGNISYRIGPNEVLCTPTLVSKYDLTPEDISLTDLEGKQIAGRSRAPARCCCIWKFTRPCPRQKPSCTAIRRTPRLTPSPAACRPTW